MITIKRATRESQKRDKGRHRLLLEIGRLKFHLSQDEATKLLHDLRRLR
jgi:hypothetical protein